MSIPNGVASPNFGCVVRPPSILSKARILSIDALRGFVMLLMLVDHTREFFFLHAQVGDPMDVAKTEPALFFTRLVAHLCAPVFILLTGLSAWLYAAPRGGAPAAAAFLAKRGLFLIVLELTVVSFGWSFDPTPPKMYLQVIWAIGVSMLALAALVRLPRGVLATVGLVIVIGHNLLDPISFAPGTQGHVLWAILHERSWIDLPWDARIRTSYPVLPWIGVIAIGYAIGPWFARETDALWRRRTLVLAGAAALLAFVALRSINLYGETQPWHVMDSGTMTMMSFFNLTKYPPSADFLLLTLGCGAWLLVAFERMPGRTVAALTVLGSAPLFFYVAHLYLLHLLNRTVGAFAGVQGWVSLPNVGSLWLLAALVAVPCWFACRKFGAAKRASDAWWMRYL